MKKWLVFCFDHNFIIVVIFFENLIYSLSFQFESKKICLFIIYAARKNKASVVIASGAEGGGSSDNSGGSGSTIASHLANCAKKL